MGSFFTNITRGIIITLQKAFQSPYRSFGISWAREKLLKHDSSITETSFLYKGKYRIHYQDRGAFLLSVREIFTERLYEFKPSVDRPRILDCGGHIGMSALFFLEQYPNCRLTVFEPDATNYQLLQKNSKGWKTENTEVVHAAVWVENGVVEFESNRDMSSAINLATQPLANKVSVPSIRLRDKLNEPVDFLKMDIEGAEYAVLLDCRDQLKNVKNLFVEYHGMLDESDKLTELLSLFTQSGFKYYLTEAGRIHLNVFSNRDRGAYKFDQQLNIFCFRD